MGLTYITMFNAFQLSIDSPLYPLFVTSLLQFIVVLFRTAVDTVGSIQKSIHRSLGGEHCFKGDKRKHDDLYISLHKLRMSSTVGLAVGA